MNLTEKTEILNSVLYCLGISEVFEPLNLGKDVVVCRNFDFCGAFVSTDEQRTILKNFAYQLGMTETLKSKNDIEIYKTPYKEMVNKKIDTSAHAKKYNLVPVKTERQELINSIENENREIENEKRKLNKQGIAVFSDRYNKAMTEKFEHSTNQHIQALRKVIALKK